MYPHLSTRIDALEEAMADRLYMPRRRLPQMLRAAKGRLPRPVLHQAAELVDAKARLKNPATARDLNANRIAATCLLVERALAEIPDGKYRRRFWTARLGTAALNLLLVILAFSAYLWWRAQA